jgi:hypothetical protein
MPNTRITTSLVNEFANPSVVISSDLASGNALWPIANARFPERSYEPFRGTRTLDLTESIYFDRGAVLPLGYIGVTRVNCASVLIRTGNAGQTTPPFDDFLFTPTPQTPVNRRYNVGHAFPSGFSCRYVTIILGAGATLAESFNPAEPFRLCGGVWGGLAVSPPMNPVYDVQWTTVDPREPLEATGRAVTPRLLRTGYPRARVTMNLRAKQDWLNPFGRRATVSSSATIWTSPTLLREYADYIGRLNEARTFAWFANTGDPSLAFIMQVVDDESAWSPSSKRRATSTLTLEEVVR